jgi:hypothetical protein
VPVVVRRSGASSAELVLQATEKAGRRQRNWSGRSSGCVTPVAAELVSRTNSQLHGGLSVAAIVRPDSACRKGGHPARRHPCRGCIRWEMLTLDNVVFVLSHPDLPTFNPLRFYIVQPTRSTAGGSSRLNELVNTLSSSRGTNRGLFFSGVSARFSAIFSLSSCLFMSVFCRSLRHEMLINAH